MKISSAPVSCLMKCINKNVAIKILGLLLIIVVTGCSNESQTEKELLLFKTSIESRNKTVGRLNSAGRVIPEKDLEMIKLNLNEALIKFDKVNFNV